MPLRQPQARFAVIGQPVDHSLSPHIHRAFARQWSVDLDYTRIALEPAALAAGVRIGAGAMVERSVIGEGCVIGDGARVEESVLLPGVVLQAGSAAVRAVRWI